MKNEIFLVEDHHEVLRIWKKEKIRSLDLVHIDGHIDFGSPAPSREKKHLRKQAA